LEDAQQVQRQALFANLGQLQQRIQQRQQLHDNLMDADFDLFDLEQEQMQFRMPPVPPVQAPAQNANQQVGLPSRYRVIPLHNDLSCVGIPEGIEKLSVGYKLAILLKIVF
jgi:hypothetical protein